MNKEQEIIKKFGKNSTGNGKTVKPNIKFDLVELVENYKISEFYTYRNRVYIIDNKVFDIPFSAYNEEQQELIFKSIMK